MWERIVAFFMAIIAFFASLFGIGGNKNAKSWQYMNEKYGENERQVLDMYIPKNVTDGRCGLVLMIHGGAWIAGDKSSFGTDALKYISDDLGIAAARINYRYINETTDLNDLMDDIDAAVNTIKAKGAEHDINIDKALLTGSSAGAHLSLLYAYSRKDTAAVTPACVVSFCGPTNLADRNFYYNNNMGSADYISQLMSCAAGYSFHIDNNFDEAVPYLDKVSPLTYVNASTVPTAIGHGAKDTTVPYSNAVDLDAKLTEYGVKHDFVTYPNSDHDLANDPECAKQMNDLMYSYAMAYIK